MKETNMEHYRGEIEDVGYRFALVNGEIQKCIGTYCVQCDFYKFKFGNCNGDRISWLMSEYKPEPVLTAREKHFVEFVQTGYIARDKSGGMWWHEKKPAKDNEEWQSFSYTMAMNSKPYKYGKDFPFITWEDEEAWSVEDLRKLKVQE